MRLVDHPEEIASFVTPTPDAPWRVLLSGCIAGWGVAVDGSDYGLGELLRDLKSSPLVEFVPFCPEDHSIGTPRTMPDVHGGDGHDVLDGRARVLDEHGRDLTDAMLEGADAMLDLARRADVQFAILTDMSGACGTQVISDGCRFDEPRAYQLGAGVAAATLIRAGIPVVSQRDYHTLGVIRERLGLENPHPGRPDHHRSDWVLQNLGPTAPTAVAGVVRRQLEDRADPEKAGPMRDYMKSEMPFLGVQSKPRKEIERAVRDEVRALAPHEWRALANELWREAEFREERYMALAILRLRERDLEPSDQDWLRRLIVEGEWWDLVDELATRIISPWIRRDPSLLTTMDDWIEDPVLWVRRAALLSQLKCKEETDSDRLFGYALRCADETDFFIRKAIGWALRQYAKTNPDAVREFVDENEDVLSALSVREATKHLPDG